MSWARTLTSSHTSFHHRSCRLQNFRNISDALLTYSLHTKAAELPRKSPLAFAFDIDGVLLQGKDVLPQAKRALKILEGDNELRIKIPYILMTNGGGISERERCQRLQEQLGVKISESQFIQSHTVLKSVLHKYADTPVLVLGGKGDDVRCVAEGYGFRKVHTTLDIHAWNPSIWPFHELSPTERQCIRPFDPTDPISAILVFHDPRNWALDIQIISDVLQSQGCLGNIRNQGNHDDGSPVELVFCNPDLLWRSDFPIPRFGQGAFRMAFQAIYKTLTGKEYPYVQYGKPTEATYRFAEQALRDHMKELYPTDKNTPLPHVYMVGDNPESDIAGANAARWSSVLVETGVYESGRGPPTHRPTFTAKDVEEAVHRAIQREFAETK